MDLYIFPSHWPSIHSTLIEFCGLYLLLLLAVNIAIEVCIQYSKRGFETINKNVEETKLDNKVPVVGAEMALFDWSMPGVNNKFSIFAKVQICIPFNLHLRSIFEVSHFGGEKWDRIPFIISSLT